MPQDSAYDDIRRLLSPNIYGDTIINSMVNVRPGIGRNGSNHPRRTIDEVEQMEHNMEIYRSFYEQNPGCSPFEEKEE